MHGVVTHVALMCHLRAFHVALGPAELAGFWLVNELSSNIVKSDPPATPYYQGNPAPGFQELPAPHCCRSKEPWSRETTPDLKSIHPLRTGLPSFAPLF